MAVKYFSAVVERGESGFGVYFPDLPGCTSSGDTIEQAAAHAEEALALHLAGMAEDREAIPEPTPFDRIERDPEVIEAARLLVRAEMPGRIVRVNVTFDEGLLSAADAAASRLGQSRSAFLADAVRGALRGAEQR
jgi:predicted RNase H-like HicB family nuclease